MLRFLHYFSELPSLKQLPLKRYYIDFSLNRLYLGVDNIHLDVYVSPQVFMTVKRLALLLLIKHTESETFSSDYEPEECEKEKKTLRNFCTEIMLAGINKGRAESEVQIDFLSQASLAKLFLTETMNAYGKLLQNFESLIRTCELSPRHDPRESFRIKDKLFEIRHNSGHIITLVRKDLFQVFSDVQADSLHSLRELNFQYEHILPDHFFNNPALCSDRTEDDFLLVEDYALFGQRADDPDNYNNINLIINELLTKTDLVDEITSNQEPPRENVSEELNEECLSGEQTSAFDPWLMEIDNIDLLLNYFDSEQRYVNARAKKEAKNHLDALKAQKRTRQKLLYLSYRKFKQSKLIRLIVAAHEVKWLYGNYCPPLRPLQLREFLVNPRSRKNIVKDLKRRKSIHGNDVSVLISSLYAAIDRIEHCSATERERHLFNFIRCFAQYRRDLRNARLLREAMDRICLVQDEKTLLLSRENHSLYEFLLPDERVKQETPIISHVIVKADIRGSVEITSQLHDRGLNPASYFSLNFFDPITEILFEYGGAKEFIEGDAIILSLSEHEDRPEGWYGVARACALAIRMLRVTQQYNAKNQHNHLPLLEFGIGICYQKGPPTFLFDGNNRIMISPAINLADRLSSCDKMLRAKFRNQQRIFNLFIYQSAADEEPGGMADDVFQRYNVNGIELNTEGFVKLSREIKLKKVQYPVDEEESVTLYTGKVPTLTGQFQPIVIREDAIIEVKPGTLEVIGKASRKYYEVCVNPAIYEYVKGHT